MSQFATAVKRAESFVKAIDKKLGDTKGFVRLIESPEFTYIELGFREKGKSQMQEVQVAYAADYFESIKTQEDAQALAKRILKDVRISMDREDDEE